MVDPCCVCDGPAIRFAKSRTRGLLTVRATQRRAVKRRRRASHRAFALRSSFATTKARRETFGCLVFTTTQSFLIADTGTAAEYSAERYKIVMCQYLARRMIFCDTKAHQTTIALKCLSRLRKTSRLSHIKIGRHFGITVAHSDAVQSGRIFLSS
jgi:hypothetical protein